MLLHIDDHKRIEDLQEHFNECFPYLKMEFYKTPHKWLQECEKSNLIDSTVLIGSVRKKHFSGPLEIKSWDKTGKVEQDLSNLFGLNAQVFRMYKTGWIQTSYSDDLTLKQQSEIAGYNLP